ncbi:MAG: hypothetical protein MZV70_12745 [Desulfobacterales bacterium]|nr:hypothetical protein [Desulfobacterales bacterium]
MVYKAAWQKDQGNLDNNLEVAQAKYLAGELALQVLAVRHEDPRAPTATRRNTRWRDTIRDAPTYAMVEGSANICKFIMRPGPAGDPQGEPVGMNAVGTTLRTGRLRASRG